MYRIGEFSYLCETTIKTLRHYDKIGILKPQSVDIFTGYRYYDSSQLHTFKTIKELQKAGLTLKEIKEYINNPSKQKIEEKITSLESKNKENIKLLEKIKSDKNNKGDNNMEYEFTNKNLYALGIMTIIKNRNEIERRINEVDKLVKVQSFLKNPIVFISYEVGYKKEDICCFIGRQIEEKDKLAYEIIALNNKKLVFDGSFHYPNEISTKRFSKMDNYDEYFYTSSKINDIYIDLIKYANEHNIQLRHPFIEIYKCDYTQDKPVWTLELRVEARNLSIENEEAIKFNNNLKEKLQNIHDKKYIGTWLLQGEITEPYKIFNKNRKHYMPDTELTKLELRKDGTTNFNHITWKENYLIVKNNNITIFNPMHLKDNILEITVNGKESASLPHEYYYKRGIL